MSEGQWRMGDDPLSKLPQPSWDRVETTRPQGTTDHDIAATRVARSVLFLATVVLYGGALLFYDTPTKLPYPHVCGSLIAVLGVELALMSFAGTHVYALRRRLTLIALAVLLTWVMSWNFVQSRPSAWLGIYPVGTCFIELWLALYVRAHEES